MAPAAIRAMPIQLGMVGALPKDEHPEDGDQDDAELIDRCDLRSLADLEGAEVADPRRAGRQTRENQKQVTATRNRIELLPLVRREEEGGERADDDNRSDERGKI